jgi:hypothetical protein
MANEIVKVFDRYEDAERARSALLAAGFAPGEVRLQCNEDEAGPVEGNFLVGNGRRPGRAGGVTSAAADHGDLPYELNYDHPELRGLNLLLLDVPSDEQRARAEELLGGFGARDIAAPASAARA